MKVQNKVIEIVNKIKQKRPITEYSKVQNIISEVIRNKKFHINKGVYSKEYLDVGCCKNTHEKFINLDYDWHPDIDICWDVTRGLPIGDNSVIGIFTEHCLEHIEFKKVRYVLEEFHRVLEPSGTVRIVVPDGKLYLTRYTDIMRGEDSCPLPNAKNDSYMGLYSPIMSVNKIFMSYGHEFIYDFETLRKLLKKAGFVRVEKKTYNHGRDPELLIDTESRSAESLYVEASKR